MRGEELGIDWAAVLAALGIEPQFLLNRQGPCPMCGGTGRYRFDNKNAGRYYCNVCGSGNGFQLLMGVFGWSFTRAYKRVREAAGLSRGERDDRLTMRRATLPPSPPSPPARGARDLPQRLRALRFGSCVAESCDDLVRYLTGRRLWPAAKDLRLRGHVAAPYWTQDATGTYTMQGNVAAMLTDVRDRDGQLVTMHATYLQDGRKIPATLGPARKLLSPLGDRVGCAARLAAGRGDGTLGIAEGIETAIAASVLHDGMPVWAALNAGLLAKFEPPRGVRRLVIFPDRDVAGFEASAQLAARLSGGRLVVDLRSPPPRVNDWADVLAEHREPGED